jgi:hypothetical protein
MVLKHNGSQNNTEQMAMVKNYNDKLINQSTTSTSFPSYPASKPPFIYVTDDRQRVNLLKTSKIKG